MMAAWCERKKCLFEVKLDYVEGLVKKKGLANVKIY
jgi:hypothetical protein